MASSLHTTPLIMLNMAGEMLYILQQRLQAQRIQPAKATKVLQDVLRTTFHESFLTELFKPQRMYSVANVKVVFEKLAHSSIMRLNRTSMDKLFDLMLMGLKLQVLSCRQPQQLLEITLTHLETLKLVGQHETVDVLIDKCIQRCIAFYGPMSLHEWHTIRRALLRFLLGKRVKVSLFLQRKWQDHDGTIVKVHRGPLPYGTDEPGTVKYLEGGQVVRSSVLTHSLQGQCFVSDELLDMESTIGTNMYLELPNVKQENRPSYHEAKRALLAALGNRIQAANLQSAPKQELNLLVDLVGRGHTSTEKAKETAEVTFRMNLFPEAKDSDDETVVVIDIDGTADYKSAAKYIEDLGFDDVADSKEYKAESKFDAGEKDLLDLMDEASLK